MFTTIENHGYYKVTTDSSDKFHGLITKLSNKLPHGSGIDYDWFLHAYQYKGKIYLNASNLFHAMDEFGGYCHIYNFTAHYLYNQVTSKLCEFCHGKGYRLISEIHKYHPTMTEFELINWLVLERNITILDDHTILMFECNVCHGSGKVSIPEFELLPNRIVKGRELVCCGYGLDEYLSQMLYLCSE